MSNIQQALFQTIETIADSKIGQLKFDKTIEAIVLSDDKADVGEYELRYQDIMFKAYSSSNTIKYRKDDNVLVLVPDGDMAKRKTILSSNKQEGEQYVDFDVVIDRLGVNYVDEAADFKIPLNTKADEAVSFRLKENQMINDYRGKKFLLIGASLFVDINDADRGGDYGIKIECKILKDGITENKVFKMSLVNVTGNPYKVDGFRETIIPLFEGDLVEIVSVFAYSDNFTQGNSIVMSNLTVEYVDIREQDKSQYSGNIIAPKGTDFRNGVLYPDEKLDLIMEFKQGGQIIDTNAIKYEWFVMNPLIKAPAEGESLGVYRPWAGEGWELLTTDTEGDFTGVNERTLSVGAKFIKNFSVFKGFALYEEKGVRVSDMRTLTDHTDIIISEIQSSGGTSFINGQGSTTLSCVVKSNGSVVEDPSLTYIWYKVDENNNNTTVGTNPTYVVNASTISQRAIYGCRVYADDPETEKVEAIEISNDTITLNNITDGSAQGLIITGGFRTALYDAEGNKPDDTLLPSRVFNFSLFENGEDITGDETTILEWAWSIPSANKTLLTVEGATEGEDGRLYIRNQKDFTVGLDSKFDYAQLDNTIRLDVGYTKNNVVIPLVQYANIAITKIGDTGADGASGSQGNDGTSYVYEIQGGNRNIVYDANGMNPSPAVLNAFTLMFSKDGGTDIAKDVDTVEWKVQSSSILRFENEENTKLTKITSKTDGINNPHTISLRTLPTYDSTIQYNNYLTAKITYAPTLGVHKTFTEVAPIAVTQNGSVGLTINTIPPSYSLAAEADGTITQERSIVLKFDITKNDIKVDSYDILNYSTTSAGASVSIRPDSGDKELIVKFSPNVQIAEQGEVQIGLSVDGVLYYQTFVFNKVRSGESPYALYLSSTNGLVFKQGVVNTILVATVLKGTEDVTDEIKTKDGHFLWNKITKDGDIDSTFIPEYVIDGSGNKLYNQIEITPDDILERATFNCRLEF